MRDDEEDNIDWKKKNDMSKYCIMFGSMSIMKLFYFPFIYLIDRSIKEIQYGMLIILFILLMLLIYKSWLRRAIFRVRIGQLLYITMLVSNHIIMITSYYLSLTTVNILTDKEKSMSVILCGIYNFYILIEIFAIIIMTHHLIKQQENKLLILLYSISVIILTSFELYHFDNMMYQKVNIS